MTEPSEITSGFEYSWTISLSDYKASDGWILSYKGLNASGKIEFDADPYQTYDHKVTLSAADTATFDGGTYKVSKYVLKDDQTILLDSFTLKVNPNPLTLDVLDTRSQSRKMLEALESLELGRASIKQKSFQIAGRAIEYLTPEEIIKWKNYYSRLVAAEEGKVVNKKRFVNFTNPT